MEIKEITFNKKIFSKNLKSALKEKHMTQSELATRTGVTESAISRYVNGSRMPNIGNLYFLAVALGVNTNVLLEGVCEEV